MCVLLQFHLSEKRKRGSFKAFFHLPPFFFLFSFLLPGLLFPLISSYPSLLLSLSCIFFPAEHGTVQVLRYNDKQEKIWLLPQDKSQTSKWFIQREFHKCYPMSLVLCESLLIVGAPGLQRENGIRKLNPEGWVGSVWLPERQRRNEEDCSRLMGRIKERRFSLQELRQIGDKRNERGSISKLRP